MEVQESIKKLKEAIFLKKGTGQDFKAEEGTLEILKQEVRAEEAAAKRHDEAIEKAEKGFGAADKNAKALREKLFQMTREWRKAALELFRAEREAEDLRGEYKALLKKTGSDWKLKDEYARTIFHGSQRAWWAKDDLNPLTEDFRHKLILDNREYYTEKRGNRKPRKTKESKKTLKYIPDQAKAFIALGIPMPGWMKREHKKWTAEKAKEQADGNGVWHSE
jgi:hypothetical protein